MMVYQKLIRRRNISVVKYTFCKTLDIGISKLIIIGCSSYCSDFLLCTNKNQLKKLSNRRNFRYKMIISLLDVKGIVIKN